MPDSSCRFYLPDADDVGVESSQQRNAYIQTLLQPVLQLDDQQRFSTDQNGWVQSLEKHLDDLVTLRVNHVREWLNLNMARFDQGLPQLLEVRRTFDNLIITLKAGTKICGLQCSHCQLSCISVYHHDGQHSCQTSHRCPSRCSYDNEHDDGSSHGCGFPWVTFLRVLTFHVDALILSAGHSKAHMYVLTVRIYVSYSDCLVA